ncbi:hypothetical protein C7974DRAFT_397288 [Boeremia exigua]|uniref:uncharacterized protein n=1 Tax=Boeremia exigua TaxID=749465 RepID=UPI001E8EA06C|nr:uncharacterized protein C7974DRAFT_397288 [Boeremia exigua]KAH6621880.1 hypothetical protein C7974DRAFT_397288 [Boeremia exigua]
MTSPSSSTSCDSRSLRSSQEDDLGPYYSGRTLSIKRHTPALPWGRSYCKSEVDDPEVSDGVSKVEWCLTHPPTPGSTDLNDTRDIILNDPIRVGNECGAQILSINDGLVAKIYDPLCYSFHTQGWTNNVTAEADHDYCIEAAVYSALNGSSLEGSMPEYYGSWTADVLIDVEGRQQSREIRMILIEYIVGISMRNIKPHELSRKARENIMYKVIEADTDLFIAGVEHDDFEPRNILIILPLRFDAPETTSSYDTSFENPNLRVCIIDFGISCVYTLADREPLDERYHNPLFRWAGADMYNEYGWLSPRREATDWMWEMWGYGGLDEKYIKVVRDMDDVIGRPIYPED